MVGSGTRKLTVEILGDAKSLTGTLGEAGGKLTSFGKTGALAIGGIGLAVGGAAVAVGAGLFQIGSSFDDAYDKIRVGTGMTGENLDDLKNSFKNVVSSVPTDFASASDAITQLVQRTGYIGPEMEGVAKQMLELSRITETDLTTNIKSTQDAFNSWGVTIENQPKLLDEMFRASQITGVGVDAIAASIAGAQPQLSELGFSFEKSAALAAVLGQAGSSLEDVMPAMGKALGVAAKDGKSASDVFGETFQKIKDAPDATAAAGVALEVFGAKAGPKLASMIRDGKLSYEDLLKSMREGSDTIMGAGAETQDFAEKWTLIKNRVLVALEPLAMRVFDAVGKAMDKLGPPIDRISKAFQEGGLGKGLKQLGKEIEGAWPAVRAALGKIVVGIGQWVRDATPVVLRQLAAWGQALVDWIGPQIRPLLAKLGEFLAIGASWLLDVGLPTLIDNLIKWGDALIGWIAPRLPGFLAELAKLLLVLGEWILTEAVPKILVQAAKLGVALIGWAVEIAVPLLEGLGKLLVDLGAWFVGTAIPWMAEKGAEFGLSLVTWAVSEWVKLYTERLPAWLTDLGTWFVTDAMPWMATKGAELGGKLISFVVDELIKLYTVRLPGWLRDLIEWLGGVPGKLYEYAKQIGSKLVENIVDGIVEAPFDIGGALLDKIPGGNLGGSKPGSLQPGTPAMWDAEMQVGRDIDGDGRIGRPPGRHSGGRVWRDGLYALRAGEDVSTPGRNAGAVPPVVNVYFGVERVMTEIATKADEQGGWSVRVLER